MLAHQHTLAATPTSQPFLSRPKTAFVALGENVADYLPHHCTYMHARRRHVDCIHFSDDMVSTRHLQKMPSPDSTSKTDFVVEVLNLMLRVNGSFACIGPSSRNSPKHSVIASLSGLSTKTTLQSTTRGSWGSGVRVPRCPSGPPFPNSALRPYLSFFSSPGVFSLTRRWSKRVGFSQLRAWASEGHLCETRSYPPAHPTLQNWNVTHLFVAAATLKLLAGMALGELSCSLRSPCVRTSCCFALQHTIAHLVLAKIASRSCRFRETLRSNF